jgi:translation initiation factor 2 beta subunit (eIF-2beta)/eIF-5
MNKYNNYKFSIDGGNVILFKLKEQKYKPTITLAIESNEPDKRKEYLDKTCGELFDISGSEPVCSKHFYSIFGKSAIAMINNFGEVINSKKDIVNTMLKAHPGILYEILKNLNWKLKINKKNNKKEMIDVETWLSKLPDNQAKQFANYLKDNIQVQNLLNKIVERINSDPDTLEIKYENFLNTNGHKLRNKKKILNPLRAQALQQQETAKLLMPYNYEGMQFFKQLNPYIPQSGGTEKGVDFSKKYNELNLRLSKFNQKLDQKTHKTIIDKINVINELNEQLNDKINNINKYSALVQNKGIPVFERNISEKKINELLKEYEETFTNSVKKIVSVSTAFGKMQYLIEEQELKEVKPFYYTIGNN